MPIPPPPSEYCLFGIDHWSTCMQKGEWSGWAQAVFSVLAIGVAILLPRRDAKKRTRQAVHRAYGHALLLNSWLRNLIKGCDDHDQDQVRVAALAVEEVLEAGRSISLELLDAESATRVVACQALARRIVLIAEQLESFRPVHNDHFQVAKSEFLECQKHIQRHGVHLSPRERAEFFREPLV